MHTVLPLLVVALLAASSGPLSAQTPLTYSADSLAAPDGRVVVTNPTDGPVRIDSVAVVFAVTHEGSIWSLIVEKGDRAVSVVFLEPQHGGAAPAEPVGLDVPPGGSALVQVDGYDPCGVCRGTRASVDTLLIYAGGGPAPDSLVLDPAGIVAIEGGPGPAPEAGGVGVAVAPNPAGGRATVTLRLAGHERVRVSVVDVLGREVAVVHDGPAVDGQGFAVETADLAPGVYRVRAETLGGARATAALTVVR